ncbi:hypothetical protein AMTRI_Chr04g184940 [Amborella trichopoda]
MKPTRQEEMEFDNLLDEIPHATSSSSSSLHHHFLYTHHPKHHHGMPVNGPDDNENSRVSKEDGCRDGSSSVHDMMYDEFFFHGYGGIRHHQPVSPVKNTSLRSFGSSSSSLTSFYGGLSGDGSCGESSPPLYEDARSRSLVRNLNGFVRGERENGAQIHKQSGLVTYDRETKFGRESNAQALDQNGFLSDERETNTPIHQNGLLLPVHDNLTDELILNNAFSQMCLNDEKLDGSRRESNLYSHSFDPSIDAYSTVFSPNNGIPSSSPYPRPFDLNGFRLNQRSHLSNNHWDQISPFSYPQGTGNVVMKNSVQVPESLVESPVRYSNGFEGLQYPIPLGLPVHGNDIRPVLPLLQQKQLLQNQMGGLNGSYDQSSQLFDGPLSYRPELHHHLPWQRNVQQLNTGISEQHIMLQGAPSLMGSQLYGEPFFDGKFNGRKEIRCPVSLSAMERPVKTNGFLHSYGEWSPGNPCSVSGLSSPITNSDIPLPLYNSFMVNGRSSNGRSPIHLHPENNGWLSPQALSPLQNGDLLQDNHLVLKGCYKRNQSPVLNSPRNGSAPHSSQERENQRVIRGHLNENRSCSLRSDTSELIGSLPLRYAASTNTEIASLSKLICPAILPPKYGSVREIEGQVYLVARDQHGCRFLQQKFDEGIPQEMELIFKEIIEHIPELMVDPFGNYLMQKLLEVCTEEQRMQIIHVVTGTPGELVEISLNMHGTRVVQKLVETLKTPCQISMVVSALEPGIVTLIKDLNGNHVVQRCLECLSNEDNKFLYDATRNNCVDIATHRHGCCVIQRCVHHSSGAHRHNLIAEITANGLILSQDAFGNYVIQYILEQGIPWATADIISQLEGHYVDLSMQKFSSNVVEKCLKLCGEETRSRIIYEMVSSSHFEKLLQDPYANYVVQSALTVSKGSVHAELVEVIRPHVSILRSSPFGKRILSRTNLKK